MKIIAKVELDFTGDDVCLLEEDVASGLIDQTTDAIIDQIYQSEVWQKVRKAIYEACLERVRKEIAEEYIEKVQGGGDGR